MPYHAEESHGNEIVQVFIRVSSTHLHLAVELELGLRARGAEGDGGAHLERVRDHLAANVERQQRLLVGRRAVVPIRKVPDRGDLCSVCVRASELGRVRWYVRGSVGSGAGMCTHVCKCASREDVWKREIAYSFTP